MAWIWLECGLGSSRSKVGGVDQAGMWSLQQVDPAEMWSWQQQEHDLLRGPGCSRGMVCFLAGTV